MEIWFRWGSQLLRKGLFIGQLLQPLFFLLIWFYLDFLEQFLLINHSCMSLCFLFHHYSYLFFHAFFLCMNQLGSIEIYHTTSKWWTLSVRSYKCFLKRLINNHGSRPSRYGTVPVQSVAVLWPRGWCEDPPPGRTPAPTSSWGLNRG